MVNLFHATAKQVDRGIFCSFNLSPGGHLSECCDVMKIIHVKLLALICLPLAAIPFLSSCGAPDPGLQREMNQDILSAAERRGPGDTTGAQQGQGSRNYGHGGF